MTTTVVSTLAALVLAALGLALVAALTLAPFLVTVELAERRGAGSVRWAVACVVCSLVGLAAAAVALSAGLGLVVAAFGEVATWAAPLALLLLGDARGRWVGTRGRHE